MRETKQLPKRLREAREVLRWSQNELAKQAGVSQAVISRIESGQKKDPAWTTIAKIAKALELTTEELMGV